MPEFVQVILNILTSGLPCALLALGIFMTFKLLDFADMTAEGSFLVGGVICLSLIKLGVNPYVTLLASFACGFLCGIVTGFLYARLGIPKLLSGIITMTATTSIAMLIIGLCTDGSVFGNLVTLDRTDPTIYSIFYIKDNPSLNPVIETIVMIVILIIMMFIMYFFFGTEYGMAIRATGLNEPMARAQGINTNRATIIGVGLSNSFIGLAGALFAMDNRSMDIKSAAGFLVIGLAAILIGEAIFGKRSFKNSIISVVLGSIVYFVIVVVAIKLGLPTELKSLLYAILITIALCLPLIEKGCKNLWKELKNKCGRKEAAA